MMTIRAHLALLAVLTLTSTVAGCSSPDTVHQSKPLAVGPVPVVTSPAQITRPIDAYQLRPEQFDSLHRKWVSGVNMCLGAEGVKVAYHEPNPNPQPQPGERHLAGASQMYGFFDPSVVAQRGYAIWGGVENVEENAPKVDTIPEGTLRQCQSKSWQALGLPAEGVGLTYALGDGPGQPPTTPEFTEVVGKWRSCMSGSGFTYDHPYQALSDERWTRGPADATQKATAKADVDCKLKTNLVGVAVAVRAAHDANRLRDNESVVKERYAQLLNALAQ